MINQYSTLQHKPLIEDRIIAKDIIMKVYKKTEYDDNFLHRQTKSVSINADILEKCDIVEINLAHLGVVIRQGSKRIINESIVRMYYGERKYYYPIDKWLVIHGNPDWYKRYEIASY